MERVIRERMTLQSQDQSVITPQALINIRPVAVSYTHLDVYKRQKVVFSKETC